MRERKPKDSEEASQLADDYAQARRHVREEKKLQLPMNRGGEKQASLTGPKRCYSCGRVDHLAHKCRHRSARSGGARNPRVEQQRQERHEVVCYNCGQKGHISTRCPTNALFCVEKRGHSQERGVRRHGVVEGRYVRDIVLDTGWYSLTHCIRENKAKEKESDRLRKN